MSMDTQERNRFKELCDAIASLRTGGKKTIALVDVLIDGKDPASLDQVVKSMGAKVEAGQLARDTYNKMKGRVPSDKVMLKKIREDLLKQAKEIAEDKRIPDKYDTVFALGQSKQTFLRLMTDFNTYITNKDFNERISYYNEGHNSNAKVKEFRTEQSMGLQYRREAALRSTPGCASRCSGTP